MIAPKLRGDMAEIMFLVMCAHYGYHVTKPYGDSYPYDFLVQIGTTAWRVQVKGCNEPSNKGRYRCNCCHTGSGRPYRKNEVDFVACYLFRTKTWYIIPQSAIKGRTAVHLFGPQTAPQGTLLPILRSLAPTQTAPPLPLLPPSLRRNGRRRDTPKPPHRRPANSRRRDQSRRPIGPRTPRMHSVTTYTARGANKHEFLALT